MRLKFHTQRHTCAALSTRHEASERKPTCRAPRTPVFRNYRSGGVDKDTAKTAWREGEPWKLHVCYETWEKLR